MKLVGITQRVEIISENEERRDALDQRWASFLIECGYMIYPIPNCIEMLPAVLLMPLYGVILTGGNTLDTDAPERDVVETTLLKYSIDHALPLLGVCRGMQIILNHFGSVLKQVSGHVVNSHSILLEDRIVDVNSYHNYGAYEVTAPLKVIGKSEDGVIEAIEHDYLPIKGVMWHPERHQPFTLSDKNMITHLFGLFGLRL